MASHSDRLAFRDVIDVLEGLLEHIGAYQILLRLYKRLHHCRIALHSHTQLALKRVQKRGLLDQLVVVGKHGRYQGHTRSLDGLQGHWDEALLHHEQTFGWCVHGDDGWHVLHGLGIGSDLV